ncbi:MAG: hypothetical protein CSA22_04420 [Deltaproteobacteria bacterium]|nr:MAG: hypothetical protein CSA22_04420 [Deltaproteobacteria bacterium]
MPESIYQIPLGVRFSETDAFGILKPVAVFNYFQDVSSAHTAALGVSARELYPMGKSWVVFRYRLFFERYPVWNEALTLRTWRCPDRRLYEMRMFEIRDANACVIISGKGSWVLISVGSKKPLRLDRNLPAHMQTGTGRIENDLGKLPQLSGVDWQETFRVRHLDIDFNQHVNNAVYIGWIWEQMPEVYRSGYRMRSLDIQFVGDAVKGDVVTVETQCLDKDAHVFLHRVSRERGSQEVTRVQTVWQPNTEWKETPCA